MDLKTRLQMINTKGFMPESKFGQNFLFDEGIIQRIIDLCGISKADKVLEIGPGLGSLSFPLSEICDDLTVVEIDKRLAVFLEESLKLDARIISSDYLKLGDYDAGKFDVIVSNLPYYVMTDIMKKIMDECSQARKMVFMVEKDALARIMAEPDTKQYGPLSILVSVYGGAKHEFDVPRDAFVPSPNTTSCVISLTKDGADIPDGFVRFINRAFAMRRKKLVNNIKEAGPVLNSLGLDRNVRAEQISPFKFIELYNAIMKSSDHS